MAKKVLVIDSSVEDVEILKSMLAEEYELRVVDKAPEAMPVLREFAPDVIVMDPVLEGLNSEAIANEAKSSNPAIQLVFLSEVSSLEASIKAYEMGVDDFIPKPYNPVEVYHKIKSYSEAVNQRRQLNQSMETARAAAFSAMESNSELGVILRYLENIMALNSFDDLANALNQVASDFGVRFVIQFRGVQGRLNYGCANDSFEASLLTKSLEKGKVIEGAYKAIINEKQISLLVKSMPERSDPRYGRLKDNLVMIVNSTENRINTLNKEIQLEEQRESSVQGIIQHAKNHMADLQQHFSSYEKNVWKVISEFRDQMETRLISLGLPE